MSAWDNNLTFYLFLVPGYVTVSGSQQIALLKVTGVGVLDTSFDGDGRWTQAIEGVVENVIEQSDGKIVLIGRAINPGSGNSDCFAARLNANGSADTSFGTSGFAYFDFDGGADLCFAGALASDGLFYIAAEVMNTTAGTGKDAAVMRFDASGNIDTNFGENGWIVMSDSYDSRAYDIDFDSEDRILVSGHTRNTGDTYNIVFIMRILR